MVLIAYTKKAYIFVENCILFSHREWAINNAYRNRISWQLIEKNYVYEIFQSNATFKSNIH